MTNLSKRYQINVGPAAYEKAKKAAKREGKSITEWIAIAIEYFGNSDAKLKRFARLMATQRKMLFGSEKPADAEPKASPKPAPKPEPKPAEPAPEVDKFAEQRAALKRLMEQHVLACKAGDREAMERIAAEARAIKATMMS